MSLLLQPITYPEACAERFWTKVRKAESCWLWTAATSGGYGVFGIGFPRKDYAHRIAFQLLRGPIPEGMVLDHLCRNRACVNPDHLEIVTNRENIVRGDGWAGTKARQTHCIHGHELAGENLAFERNGTRRRCLTCRRERERRRVRTKAV